MLTPRIHSFLCRISNLLVAVNLFLIFNFFHNQTPSTNYGVVVSAPNCALFSLVPGSKRSFCSLIGSFDGQRFLCLTKEIVFDLL